MTTPTLVLLLLMFGFGLITGSGRNIGMRNDEDFAVWHREYGKTMRMVSWWGLGVVALCAAVRVFA